MFRLIFFNLNDHLDRQVDLYAPLRFHIYTNAYCIFKIIHMLWLLSRKVNWRIPSGLVC